MNKNILAIVLPIVIVVGVYFAYKGAKRKPHSESAYSYTTYGIAEDGTIYVFGVDGPGLKWPVNHEGKELKPLYGCTDCGHIFPASIDAMTTQCPKCGGPNVGGYDEELYGPVDAIRIEIEQPKRR